MDPHAKYSTLPVIELNEKKLTPGTDSWKSTSDSVRQALESYGCFVVAYNDQNISSELYDETFALTADLFRLPMETKRRHTSEIPGFGYGGNFSVMPLFEYFGIEDGGAKKFTRLMWPEGHNKFCETIHSYCKLLSKVDHLVMKMVASSYDLEKYYDPLIQSSIYMTRLMRYQSPGEKSSVGLVPHRDKSFMSVIGTNEVEGLEIETRDGNWIDYEPSLGKFIVIVGEALMAWSNGRIYCPLHKVTARGTKEKYSIGIFSFVRGVLQVPQELVDDQNPLKFKSFSNLEFLEYCKEGGAKMKEAIQTYCGI
ncbi:probable 2-oxoglutarate-dependent dioxygenase aop1 [Phtheirospermum japonicum]|uniref:Probable 2-oxoglutarate-dependent dioxygenase aop1 n=1 Tax=Phtheirospermum japonicum TaxID=374723 RepID=A0A830CE90_9LAMI|nr:probable 2-oxoglutarate-dependent dioxygenase aop1 [Phtheirospermum japonicum]